MEVCRHDGVCTKKCSIINSSETDMPSIKREKLVRLFLYGLLLIGGGILLKFLHIPYVGSLSLITGLVLVAVMVYTFFKEYR